MPNSSLSLLIEIFYENGALEALIALSIEDSCPDYQHTLETIVTLASAKENALMALTERDAALIERFETKLNERRQLIQGSEEYLVRSWLVQKESLFLCSILGRNGRDQSNPNCSKGAVLRKRRPTCR